MIFFKNIALFAIVLLLTLPVLAQEDLPGGQVDVIKSFDAHLLDTERHGVKPQLPPLDTTTRPQVYNILTKSLIVEYLPPKIRPLAMKGDALQKNYNGYAKLGGGLPSAFYLDGSYNVISKKNYDFGINAFHHSANNNRNVENQRFSNTNINVDGNYYFEQGFAVNGHLGYKLQDVYYYGYNDLNEELDSARFSFASDDVRQRFSTFSAGGRIFNGERTEADFNYSAGFEYYHLEDDFAAREDGFNLLISGTKWFNEAHPLTLSIETDFTTYRDTSEQDLNNFYLRPSYTYHGGGFKAKIGANITSSNDEFSIFPDIEVSANLVEGILGAFVGAEGSLQKNNFKNLTDYNPFISSRIRVRNTKYFHFYGGIKGNYQGIDYHAQIGYKTADDLALYQLPNALDSVPRFDVLYDTVNIVNIKASLSVPLFEDFELTGSLTQSIFSPQTEDKAWHLPTTSLNVLAKYKTLDGKLLVKGELFLENGVPFRDSDGETKNLNALFDVSLGAEYYFTDNIGAFASLNNLANNKRQRWHRYPVFGLNALFGITARF